LVDGLSLGFGIFGSEEMQPGTVGKVTTTAKIRLTIAKRGWIR
jgi:hypothetical protein